MIPLLLLFIGFLLIYFEFFLPGGVLGTVGAVTVIVSVFLFASESDSLIATLLFLVGVIAGLIILLRFALWRIKKGKPGHTVYSEDDQEGFVASSFDKGLIGKEGIVTSELRPGGHVRVEKRKWAAISESGYLPKGSSVVVIGGSGESLIVKLKKKDLS